MPKASFIGFTGKPIERSFKKTRAVFGDYIDVYPPDKQEKATKTVLEQAKLLCVDWAS